MNFTNDIFISYKSSEDSFSDVSKIWMNAFIYYLEVLLKKLMDTPPRIIISDNLAATDRLKNLSETAVFIPVLSFETLNSEAYGEELKAIEKILTSENEINSNHRRLIPVLRSCISIEQLPSFMRESKYFDFCNITPDVESFKKKSIRSLQGSSEHYWTRMVDLAYSVKESLRQISEDLSDSRLQEEKKYVYLATTSLDQQYYREQIRHELEQMKLTVLPDIVLSNNGQKAENQAHTMIEKCFLSIHIIGETYGKFLENSDYSAIDIQNRVAAGYQKEILTRNGNASVSFSRIIWMAPEMKPDEEKQASYIEQLKKDRDNLTNVEIMQTPLEMLRSILHKKTKDHQEMSMSEKTNTVSHKTVYMLYEKDDEEKINPFADWFINNDYQPASFFGNNDSMGYLKLHRQKLASCDVVFIYFTSENTQWIRSNMQDIVKSNGYRHDTNKPAKKIIYTSNAAALPVEYLTEDVNIIESGTFNAVELEKVITK